MIRQTILLTKKAKRSLSLVSLDNQVWIQQPQEPVNLVISIKAKTVAYLGSSPIVGQIAGRELNLQKINNTPMSVYNAYSPATSITPRTSSFVHLNYRAFTIKQSGNICPITQGQLKRWRLRDDRPVSATNLYSEKMRSLLNTMLTMFSTEFQYLRSFDRVEQAQQVNIFVSPFCEHTRIILQCSQNGKEYL